jgi:hypothetical protein
LASLLRQRKPRPGIRGSGAGASLVRTIAVEPGKTVRTPLLPLAWEKLSGGLASTGGDLSPCGKSKLSATNLPQSQPTFSHTWIIEGDFAFTAPRTHFSSGSAFWAVDSRGSGRIDAADKEALDLAMSCLSASIWCGSS